MARISLLPVLMTMAACANGGNEYRPDAFDLEITHPSPQSTYLSIAPGRRGAKLPQSQQIRTRSFSEYLREQTGCVLDSSSSVAVLGNAVSPAGYMVPVSCS